MKNPIASCNAAIRNRSHVFSTHLKMKGLRKRAERMIMIVNMEQGAQTGHMLYTSITLRNIGPSHLLDSQKIVHLMEAFYNKHKTVNSGSVLEGHFIRLIREQDFYFFYFIGSLFSSLIRPFSDVFFDEEATRFAMTFKAWEFHSRKLYKDKSP